MYVVFFFYFILEQEAIEEYRHVKVLFKILPSLKSTHLTIILGKIKIVALRLLTF